MYSKTIYNPNKPENSTFTTKHYSLDDAVKSAEGIMGFAQEGVIVTITDEDGNIVAETTK